MEDALVQLLEGLSWPESAPFCRSAVLCSFTLFKAALGVPCLLRLYHRGSTLDKVLIYLSKYFTSTFATTLYAQFDKIVASHTSGNFGAHSTQYSDLMDIFGRNTIFASIIQQWTTSMCDSSSKRDELARWLLSLRLLPINSPDTNIEQLIIKHAEDLGQFLTHIITAAAQLESESDSEPNFFEKLHSHFFEGLMQHMAGKSSKMVVALHNVVQWSDAEKFVSRERLNKWRHFEAVASQYTMCDDGPQFLYEATKNLVIIENAKIQVPDYRLNWEALKIVFSANSAASQQPQNITSSSHTSIGQWSMEEIENFLTNVWINMEGKENEIKARIPLDWLLALIDQAPLKIVYLAYVILESALEAATDVKLALFSPFLLNFFESLLRLQYSPDGPSKSFSSSKSSIMDVDPSLEHDISPVSTEQKIIFVKSLFRKLRKNRSVCASVITDIISRLCSGSLEGGISNDKWTLPIVISEASSAAFQRESQNTSLNNAASSNGTMLIDAQPQQTAISHTEKLDAHSSSVLSNVRKRCRMIESDASFSIEPVAKRMTNGVFEPSFLSSSSSTSFGNTLENENHLPIQAATAKIDLELLFLAETLSLPITTSSTPSASSSDAPTSCSNSSQMGTSYESQDPARARLTTGGIGDLSSRISETLVAEVDGRYPLVSAYDVYFDVLPKKPLFERNRYLEQLFLQRPILWSILEVISANTSNLYPCRHIIMTLLTNFVGAWNAQPKSESAISNSLWRHTLVLLRLLDLCCNAGPISGHNTAAPTYDPLMQGVGVALELCKTEDVALLLLGYFRFCVARLSSQSSRNMLGASLQAQNWVISPLKFILRKNVHLLSEKALFLYRRLIAIAAQTPVSSLSFAPTPALSQQHQTHGNAPTTSASQAALNNHPIPQNIL